MWGRKKKLGPKKKIGGRNFLGGGRKRYLAAEHHNEAAPKKKKAEVFPLGGRKIPTSDRFCRVQNLSTSSVELIWPITDFIFDRLCRQIL